MMPALFTKVVWQDVRMGRLATLRAACRNVVRDVVIPQPFDVATFCAEIARQRGRPLHLHQIPASAGPGVPCGLWLATDQSDHVFHVTGATPLHRAHIVLHEIGHMLCDHVTKDAGSSPWSSALLPHLEPELVARVLLRSSYEDWQEQMAEMVASLILA